jgi:subtilisin family serine protease
MPGRVGGAATIPTATALTLDPLPAPTGEPFVVGVIDTGITRVNGRPHPFLAEHLTDSSIEPPDVLPTDGQPLGADDGHGTFVAGTILRHAPDATIHMVNVLDEFGLGGDDTAVAQAIHALASVDNLKLVNLPFVGYGLERPDPPLILRDALRDLLNERPDLLVVTAAGNSGTDAKAYPAGFTDQLDRLLAIGAVDESVVHSGYVYPPRASFSNYGPWVSAYCTGVLLLGPSCFYTEQIGPEGRPAQTFTGWCLWSGTSFAAATVTGLLAKAMLGGQSAANARETVISGPKLPMPGVAAADERPYVHVDDTTWPAPRG